MDQVKVLITGSNGLLGEQLRRLLSKNNFFIIATGLGPDRSSSIHDVYVEMDITSLKQCTSILYKYEPSVIINAAAMTNVDQSERDQKKCLSINCNSINNFIPYINKHSPHFIHISSDFIFNGQKGLYVESDCSDPVNYYGFSKLESEKIILNHAFNYTILRTSLVYGESCDHNHFLNWVKRQLMSNQLIEIVDDQYRTPTFVNDLAISILNIIQMKKYGIYHVSSGEKLSIFDIVNNIAKHYQLDYTLINKIKSKDLPQFAKRPLDTSLQIDKAVKELGFYPTKLNNALNIIL